MVSRIARNNSEVRTYRDRICYRGPEAAIRFREVARCVVQVRKMSDFHVASLNEKAAEGAIPMAA
jgi:hypothetical protein